MPEIGDVFGLAIQGISAAGSLGAGAILFGWYDRRRKTIVDDRSFETAEEKELRQEQATFLAEIKADRVALQTRLRGCEEELEEVSTDRERWRACADAWRAWARDALRHPANDIIQAFWFVLTPTQRKAFGGSPPKLPEIPPLADMFPPPLPK